MKAEFPLAVHALVYLHHRKTWLSSETLAENICTNPARVRKVMAELRRAGLVETREGQSGGYRYPEGRRETLCGVADALGVRFAEASWRSGSVDMDCLVASGMAGVMDGIYSEMDAACRERLAGITVEEIDEKLTSAAKGGEKRGRAE